jgi:hypothetical protein
MSLLAIVSKAVFEKDARIAGHRVTAGDVWPIDRYVSSNPNLTPLSVGGSLFLVTVRPSDVLWLVGVLERPALDGEAWRGAPNAIPVTDITALLPKLRLASGKGVSAGPGKLGMSLQTPRALATEDESLLRAAVAPAPGATAKAAYVAAVLQTATAQAGAALAADLARTRDERGLLHLRFDRYERWTTWAAVDDRGKAQAAKFQFDVEEAEEFGGGLERMDVVDEQTGKVRYQLYLWPFGSGALFTAETTDVVADICQHSFMPHQVDRVLRESMAVAYHEALALGVQEHVDFSITQAEQKATIAGPPPSATVATASSVDDRVSAMRRDAAEGKPQPDHKELGRLVCQALERLVDVNAYRPFPVRRAFELTPGERNALELLVDRKTPSLALIRHGLPGGDGVGPAILSGGGYWREDNDLVRFLQRGPALPIDVPIEVEGQRHPAWCLVSDVLYASRPATEVLDLFAFTLPVDRLAALWEGLLTTPLHNLRGRLPVTPEEDRKGQSTEMVWAHGERIIDLLVQLGLRLGDLGRERALAHAATLEKAYAATLEKAETPEPFEVVAVLRCLAAHASRAGDVLDPRYDAMLEVAAMRYSFNRTILRSILALMKQLPPERAARVAGESPELVEQFPSKEGAARLLRKLEKPDCLWQGPYWDKKLRTVFVDALGELAREPLVESSARPHGKRELVQSWLELLDRKGKKRPRRG